MMVIIGIIEAAFDVIHLISCKSAKNAVGQRQLV